MQPNPVLAKLGLSAQDRAVIIHTDDIGMCQASVSAFAGLHAFGLISSGAIMVPCPWFLEAARYARRNPTADLGVHLTLTSEWETYRWGPVSTRDPSSGLLDEQGCFHSRSAAVQLAADPAAVQRELEAQFDRAAAAGIRPTHIDTHMGAVAHVRLMAAYLNLALSHGIPMLMARLDEAGFRALDLDGEAAAAAAEMVHQLEAMGIPLLDHIIGMPLDSAEERLDRTIRALDALEPGVTHFVIHPAEDTPELRAITPDWPCRVADYRTFTSDELRHFLQGSGLHVIGYRALQQLMPVAAG
jgi:hypothetical protein